MVGVFSSLLVVAFVARLAQRLVVRDAITDESFDSIEYQGQSFALTRRYTDYEDFKDDPNNLAPGQAQKLEEAVTSAPVQRSYPNQRAMVRGVMALRFPGYGLSQFGAQKQTDGSVLAGWSIEIPSTSKCRCLVFCAVTRAGSAQPTFELMDDFVVAADPAIARVEVKDGQLQYSTFKGEPVVTRCPTSSRK